MFRTFKQKRACQPSWPGPNLNRRAIQLSGAGGNTPGQVQIEQEVLPK